MVFSTTPLAEKYINEAIVLCDKYMGKGFYTAQSLSDIIKSENDTFDLVMDSDGRLVGFFYCLYRKNISADELDELCLSQIAERIKEYGVVGICKSICLVESVRGKGIAEELLNRYTQRLEDVGCEIILAPAWKKGDFIPAQRHLGKCGFSLLCGMQKPWYGKQGLVCPFCKQERCVCDAAVFMKKCGGGSK